MTLTGIVVTVLGMEGVDGDEQKTKIYFKANSFLLHFNRCIVVNFSLCIMEI